ncbi:MAG: HAD hydrolase-like protein [Candidatus Saccharicenans sp.]
MKKLIAAFDVDGVLIDVRESYLRALAETTEHFLGKPVTVEEAVRIKTELGINNDWDATLACLLFRRSGLSPEKFRSLFTSGPADFHQVYRLADRLKISLPEYRTVVEEFESRYRNHRHRERLRIPRGWLARIKSEADFMAVITGRTKEDLDFSFNRFSLHDFFEVILTEDDLPSPSDRKPSPYLLKKLLDGAGFYHRACYIGDTLSDRLMVENYNRQENKRVYFILFRHELNRQVEADFTALTPEDILQHLKRLREK